MQEGTFPRQYQLGARAVGWREDDIEEWLTNLHYVAPRPKLDGDNAD